MTLASRIAHQCGFLFVLTGCFDLNGSSWGGSGEPCYKNPPQCEKNLDCGEDGICHPTDPRPTCTLSSDCDEGHACDNGRCATYAANCADDSNCRPDYFCDAQVCVKRRAGAAVCDHGSQCATGYCSDGVCCDSPCDGVCEACVAAKTVGTDGACSAVPANGDPDDECPGEITCSGDHACALKTLGSVCNSGAECVSTFCADGVCCDGACDEACQSCGATGACNRVTSREDSGACDDSHRGDDCAQVPCTCDNAGDCKSGGGTVCAMTADCAGGLLCADHVCCNTACEGTCKSCLASRTGMPTGTCNLVTTHTDLDNECAAATTCDGAGNCFAKALAEGCSQDDECTSGHCSLETWWTSIAGSSSNDVKVTIGTCCTTSCGGAACSSCRGIDTGVAAGTCAPVLRHKDPQDVCGGHTIVATRPLDCNGNGECNLSSGAKCRYGYECQSDVCENTCNGELCGLVGDCQ